MSTSGKVDGLIFTVNWLPTFSPLFLSSDIRAMIVIYIKERPPVALTSLFIITNPILMSILIAPNLTHRTDHIYRIYQKALYWLQFSIDRIFI